MTTETVTPQTWDVSGYDDDGQAETTRIELAANPEWSPEGADEQYRYQVWATLLEGDVVIEDEGFDRLDRARAYARKLVRDAESEYAERESSRRQTVAENLESIAAEYAVYDSAEYHALTEVADLIARGQAGAVLEALKAAGLI